MIDGQSYSGKESHATKNDLVGENSPQTVKNEDTSPSEAPTPSPPAGDILFELPPIEVEHSISVPVTNWIARHVQDTEKANLLRQAIYKVFRAFHSSDYKVFDRGVDTSLAYRALELSLDRMIVRAAEQVCGPLPDLHDRAPGDIQESPYQIDANQEYMSNPASCIDVEQLQKWITALQDMANIQSASINILRIADQRGDELNESLKEQVAGLQAVVQTQTQAIADLRSRIPEMRPPLRSSSVRLTLGFESFKASVPDTWVLSQALQSFRDSRIADVLTDLRGGEISGAYFSLEESKTAQSLLDTLSELLAEEATENSRAAHYASDPAHYAKLVDYKAEVYRQGLDAFTRRYSREYSLDGEEQPDTSESAQ